MRFVSTYDAGLDEKRRVTVPADFRIGLKSGGEGEHVRIWPGEGPWLEGGDDAFINALSQAAEDFAQDDPDLAEAATLAILGGSRKLSIDSAGRMVLPCPDWPSPEAVRWRSRWWPHPRRAAKQ